MTALAIGPFVWAGDRLAAVIALLVFLGVTEAAAWRRGRRGRPGGLGPWPYLVVLGWVLAARAGFVAQNLPAFAQDPLAVVALWQGGFSARTGAYGAAFVIAAAALSARRPFLPLAVAAVLAGLVSTTAMLVLQARAPAPAVALDLARFEGLDGPAGAPPLPPGRPVVLNLWASWCGPCRREMPMLQEVAAQSPGVAFRFVNQGETAPVIRGYLLANRLAGADVRLDPDRTLMARYGAIGLPATLFFDARGTLVRGVIGEISRAELLRQITDMTQPQPVPPPATP